MSKLLKLLKNIMLMIIIASMCIINYAAVVSDNDGSAFVTKAEFDALKNNFNGQIDNYNTSIDKKIDGAIASYLQGIKMSKKVKTPTLVEYAKNNYIYTYDKNNTLEYKYGWPIIWGQFSSTNFTASGSTNREVGIMVKFAKGTPATSNEQDKTVIKSLQQDKSDAWFAHWNGFRKKCIDTIYCTVNGILQSDGANEPADLYKYLIATGQNGTNNSGINIRTNTNIIGQVLWTLRALRDGHEALPNGEPLYFRDDGIRYIITPFCNGAICRGVEHDWGTMYNDEIVINKSYDYDMFSNFDRDYNFGYLGDYKTEFISGFSKKNKDVWTYFTTKSGHYNKTNNPNILNYCVSGTISSEVFATEWSSATVRSSTIGYSNSLSLAQYTNTNSTGNASFYFPCIGFERTYLTNWSQIVSPNTSEIANKEVALNNTTIGIKKGKDDTNYLSVCAGLPVADLEKFQQLDELLIEFSETGNHIVWFSNRPFDPTKNPQEDLNLLTNTTGSQYEITGGTYNTTYKGYVVTDKNVKFKLKREDDEKEEIIYMKWAKFTAPSTIKAGTGVKLGNTYIVEQG